MNSNSDPVGLSILRCEFDHSSRRLNTEWVARRCIWKWFEALVEPLPIRRFAPYIGRRLHRFLEAPNSRNMPSKTISKPVCMT
jgi:hypothetical protein